MKVDVGGSCSKLRIYFALDTECSFNGIRKMFHLFVQLRILMFVPIPEREGAARVSSALRGIVFIGWARTQQQQPPGLDGGLVSNQMDARRSTVRGVIDEWDYDSSE